MIWEGIYYLYIHYMYDVRVVWYEMHDITNLDTTRVVCSQPSTRALGSLAYWECVLGIRRGCALCAQTYNWDYSKFNPKTTMPIPNVRVCSCNYRATRGLLLVYIHRRTPFRHCVYYALGHTPHIHHCDMWLLVYTLVQVLWCIHHPLKHCQEWIYVVYTCISHI